MRDSFPDSADGPVDGPADGPAGGIDAGTASIARIYDAYLDGTDHLPVDREAAERVIARTPWAKPAARYNRDFMVRAVRAAVRAGIRQVLDIGCGMPNDPCSFSAARSVDGTVRVVGVDNDPSVLARGRERARDDDAIRIIEGDIREPWRILEDVGTLVDWSQPLALVATAVLQFVPDELDPVGLFRVLRDRMVPGGWVIFSHSSTDGTAPEVVAGVENAYQTKAVAPIKYRSDARLLAFMEGTRLLEPGLVAVQEWRPGPDEPPVPPGPVVRVAGAVGVRTS